VIVGTVVQFPLGSPLLEHASVLCTVPTVICLSCTRPPAWARVGARWVGADGLVQERAIPVGVAKHPVGVSPADPLGLPLPRPLPARRAT